MQSPELQRLCSDTRTVMRGVGLGLGWYTHAGARNSRFQTRTAYMLALDIDYRPQCVAHAHQVRDLHSMVGRGARTRTFRVRVRVRVRVRYTRAGARNSRFQTRTACILVLCIVHHRRRVVYAHQTSAGGSICSRVACASTRSISELSRRTECYA